MFNLFKKQLQWLEGIEKQGTPFTIEGPRRSGKTTFLAYLALYLANKESCDVWVLSRGSRQSTSMVDECKHIAKGSTEFQNLYISERHTIHLSHSVIRFLEHRLFDFASYYGDILVIRDPHADSIRGSQPDYTLIDDHEFSRDCKGIFSCRKGTVFTKTIFYDGMTWHPTIHYKYPEEVKQRIVTIMKMSKRPTQFGRLPKEILLLICEQVASYPFGEKLLLVPIVHEEEVCHLNM